MPFAISGGQRLYYDVIDTVAPWHDNRATILFHHGIGADSGIWTDWICALTDRYRLVRFDMRGFGRSAAPGDRSQWSMDLLWADVLAVAVATTTTRFHFIGESIGGTIGLYGALRHPDRFLSLTVSNAGHAGTSIQKVETWRRTIDETGMSGWSDEFMADRFHPDALSPERRAWFARQQAACDAHAVLSALSVLVGIDLGPELRSMLVPVLVLHPDSSPFIPVTVAAELHAGLPNAELHVFGRTKHGLPFSHGYECAATVRRFLDRRFAGSAN